MAAAGNSLDETIALTTAANTIVQNPNTVGTALKTLSLRIRGVKTELEEAGLETDGMAETTSQLQAKLKALTDGKVDIMADADTFKNTTQILREMSKEWEHMTDVEQAAALELLGGKRQANTLSAIISNFDIVEDAIESSANSAGSAMKENEKVLDSIQGRINLFNNALQTLWNNILSSDLIKTIVSWGTRIIKSLDTVHGKFLGIVKAVALLMAYKKVNPFAWIMTTKKTIDSVGLKQYFMQLISTLLGVNTASKQVTADMISQTIASESLNASLGKQVLANAGVTNATAVLTAKQKEKIANDILALALAGDMDMALAENALAMLGYGIATDGANKSVVALDATTKSFMASNPVGWILLIVSAVMTLVMWLGNTASKVDKLKGELSDLKSEISNTQSEIDSLNSELATTAERIAELEAMPSLSFVEQEELKELKAYNDELERNKLIQEGILESQNQSYILNKSDYIKEAWNSEGLDKSYYVDSYGIIHEDKGWDGFWNAGVDTKTALDTAIKEYEENEKAIEYANELLAHSDKYSDYEKYVIEQKIMGPYRQISNWEDNILSESEYNSLDDNDADKSRMSNKTLQTWLSSYEKRQGKINGSIAQVLDDTEFENLEYGMSDEIDTFLNEYSAYYLKWQKMQGKMGYSEIISSMFDKTSTKALQDMGEQFQEIADNEALTDEQKVTKIKKHIGSIDEANSAYKRLTDTMDITGITAQEIADYFVLTSSAFDSNTVEGITAQYEKGVKVLEQFKNGQSILYENTDGTQEQITFDSLFKFDEETQEYKAIDTQISKVLKGADETVRSEFGHLIETIKNEGLNYADAITSFGLSGVQAGIKLVKASVVEINNDMFKDLGDNLDGIIDTFGELSSALESVANSFELLEQAKKEMNHSDRLSIETALKLIESTEDWNDVLTISNGVITLNENATDALVNSKLNQIRSNIELEIKELETAQAQLIAAESGEDLGTTLEESTNESIRQVAANLGYLTELLQAFSEFDFGNAFSRASSAKASVLATTKVSTNETDSGMSRAEIEDKLKDAYARRDLMSNLTADNFEDTYSADKVDGSSEEEDDSFQKAMDYWENRIAANQAKYEQIQNEIDLLEKQGKIAGEEYYQEQIKLENERLQLLKQQQAAAKSYLGTVEVGSEEWWEAAGIINDIEGEIDDVTSSIQDLNDAMDEIDWAIFEETHERFGNLTSELETIRDLLSVDEDSFFDDEGQWTENGVAVLGTYIQEIELYRNALADVNEELANLSIDDFDSEQEYYDKLTELKEKQQDYTTAISNSEQEVVSMYENQIDAIEEYTSELVDSYNEYIDVVKEALDAERDLYEFKKNVQKQTKDIAQLERRIAALSGSDNASDIAERRKLQAELLEAKEGLDDTYYDHAKDAQADALDKEAEAYEESMNRYVESLRTTLDEAKLNMDLFMEQVTTAVMLNADTISAKYDETGLLISEDLTTPWTKAVEAMQGYETNGLALMNEWTTQEGYFGKFQINATNQLTSPWTAGKDALTSFQTDVKKQMEQMVATIRTNVATAKAEFNSLTSGIQDTSVQAPTTSGNKNNNGNNNNNNNKKISEPSADDIRDLQTILNAIFSKKLTVNGKYDAATKQAVGEVQVALKQTVAPSLATDGYYGEATRAAMEKWLNKKIEYIKANNSGSSMIGAGVRWYTDYKNKLPAAMYAKGTLGTTKDEWAITDEPQFGDELVLVPTAQGNLSYMRKGTSVVPAAITKNLVEWGQFSPDMMKVGGTNFNMISNAVNKPEFNFTFDALVKAEKITEDTLPEVKKFVQTEINRLVKQMNYALRGQGAR